MKMRRVYAVTVESEDYTNMAIVIERINRELEPSGVRMDFVEVVATWIDGRAEQVVDAMLKGHRILNEEPKR